MNQRLSAALLAALIACGGKQERATPAADTAAAVPARPPAELALKAPNGVEVWFTDARAASDSTGASCTERVMQIRRDGKEIAIPLLYTGAVPKLVNDSTIEAAIWLHCRPGNVYQVNLHTGHPERVK